MFIISKNTWKYLIVSYHLFKAQIHLWNMDTTVYFSSIKQKNNNKLPVEAWIVADATTH